MVLPIDLGPSPGRAVRALRQHVATHFLIIDHQWTTTETEAFSHDGSIPSCHLHGHPPGTAVILIAILGRESLIDGQWLERRDLDLLAQPLKQIVIVGVEPQSVTSMLNVIPSEHFSLSPERYLDLLTGISDKLPLVEVLKEPMSRFTCPFEDVLKLLLGLLKDGTGMTPDAELLCSNRAAYRLKLQSVMQQQADNICKPI
jgi:hypothetical protein